MVFSPLVESVHGLASISKQVILPRNADSNKDDLRFGIFHVYGYQALGHSVFTHILIPISFKEWSR